MQRGGPVVTGPGSVVVLGSSGFVGSAVAQQLRARGATVVEVRAPRLCPIHPDRVTDALSSLAGDIADFALQLEGVDAVVNAAGHAEATSADVASLTAVNALLPGFIGMACVIAEVSRFVHVSSAAVQGRAPTLDSSPEVAPLSPYARSKALGERLVRRTNPEAVVYRPPGVHGGSRRVSQMMARLARSSLSSVARPGSSPSPQALLKNVADAIAFLTLIEVQPPPIVAHPSEGLTTASLLEFLGGHAPREIPRPLARATVALLTAVGRKVSYVGANARRVEMLWLGQPQATSWLSEVGWEPPLGQDAWKALGRELADASQA